MTNFERIGLDAAKAPRPSCEQGREGALANGAITIRPGETVCFTVRAEGNSIAPSEVVASDSPDSTVVLSFWLDPTTSDAVLTIYNPLGEFLIYRAHMLLPGATQLEYTSSCPVLSKRMGIEHWPYPIAELTLSSFETAPDSATITCK
jgi:hypothetical protein